MGMKITSAPAMARTREGSGEPVVQAEPPKPAPAIEAKPEPRIDKPDIALKAPEKPKPKPKPEAAAKPAPKPVAKPAPPKPDDRLAQQR